MTDEIRGQLSKLAALRLLSRSAVQRYGDGNVRGLRSDLGAGSAVEGSVRLDGGRVRVAVELVDTATEQTLWSEQYDRTLEDVLSVQSDVALHIADALKATLTPEERKSVERLPTQILRPGLTASPLLKPETHRTTYAYMLMKRGERVRAIELFSESLKEARAALADGMRTSESRSRWRPSMPRERRRTRRSNGSNVRSRQGTRITQRSADIRSS